MPGEWEGTIVDGERRIVLIQKDPSKGTVASNYRPIACLPIMWKLLTGMFAESIYDHLDDQKLLPDEQKGCRKRSRGTKDQLLIGCQAEVQVFEHGLGGLKEGLQVGSSFMDS